MKSFTTILALALLTAATGASADMPVPGAAPEQNRAVMFYFTKSFGSDQKQNRTPLAFGLRLQQSSPFDAAQTVALADARYSFGGRKTFALAGFPAFDSTQGSSDESSTSSTTSSADMSHKHPGWTVTMIVLAVAGAMCATENYICTHRNRSTSESPGLGRD